MPLLPIFIDSWSLQMVQENNFLSKSAPFEVKNSQNLMPYWYPKYVSKSLSLHILMPHCKTHYKVSLRHFLFPLVFQTLFTVTKTHNSILKTHYTGFLNSRTVTPLPATGCRAQKMPHGLNKQSNETWNISVVKYQSWIIIKSLTPIFDIWLLMAFKPHIWESW